MPYLIDTLKEKGALDFTFISRSKLLTLKKKDGGYYDAYEYTFLIGGKEHVEKIFPQAHDAILQHAQPNQVCRASVSPKNDNWVDWKLIPFGEAALDVPKPASNYMMQKNARSFNEDKQAEEDRRNAKDIQICLQGFMQAHISAGKTNGEALQLAKDARAILQEAVMSLIEQQ